MFNEIALFDCSWCLLIKHVINTIFYILAAETFRKGNRRNLYIKETEKDISQILWGKQHCNRGIWYK